MFFSDVMSALKRGPKIESCGKAQEMKGDMNFEFKRLLMGCSKYFKFRGSSVISGVLLLAAERFSL